MAPPIDDALDALSDSEREALAEPDLLLVSVQSQKGGVGKSTAALALADLLATDEKWNVLVIDADITGTNLAHAVEASFWSDRVHVVGKNDEQWSSFDLGVDFIHEYLSGASVPSFLEDAKSVSLTFDVGRPNIMGSSFPFDGAHGGSSAESMLSEFFSPLFLEYVESIARSFHEAMKAHRANCALNTAIIIDNSPGHVGLVAELEDWVTDLGPAVGKTLFVTTPDGHDLMAVARAAGAIFSRLQTKWEASRAYLQLKHQKAKKRQGVDQRLLGGDAGQFFLSLAESDARSEARAQADAVKESVTGSGSASEAAEPSRAPLANYGFYLDRVIPAGRDKMVSDPKWSIGALVNLVPECLLEEIGRAPAERLGEMIHDARAGQQAKGELAPHSEALDVLGLSLPGSAKRFVPFDPSMRDQYMSRAYSVVSRPRAGSLQQLDEVLSRLTRRARSLGGEQDGLHYGSMRAITVAIDLANRAVDALALHGSGYGRALVRSSWLPSTILTLLRDLSQSLLPELELQITTRDFEELAERSTDVKRRANQLGQWLTARLKEDKSELRFHKEAVDLIAETLGLAVEVASHKATPFNDTRIHQTALAIIRRQRDVLSLRVSAGDGPLPRFVFTSHFLGLQFGRDPLAFESDEPPLDPATERTYLICCEAEARILDLRADVEFLFRVLRALGELKPGNANGGVRVSSIARRVIQTKETRHESGLGQLAETQVSERQLTAFEAALRSIIRDWGVP